MSSSAKVATEKFALANVDDVAEKKAPDEIDKVMDKIQDYVRKRLKTEIDHGPRGTQAGLAKALGITPAHLSNIVYSSTRDAGEYVRRAAARLWNMSYAELESRALGKPTIVGEWKRPIDEAADIAPRLFPLQVIRERAEERWRTHFDIAEYSHLTTWELLSELEREYNRQRQIEAKRDAVFVDQLPEEPPLELPPPRKVKKTQ